MNFWNQISGYFFFVPNNFKIDFFCKTEGEVNFVLNFFLVRLIFKRISLLKFAAISIFVVNCSNEFQRDLFYNQKVGGV